MALPKVTVKVTPGVTVNEQAVIALLSENDRYTMVELAGKLSLSRKTIAACMKSLKEKGVLERIGSDKNGRWNIIEERGCLKNLE